jgi:hypothetical protein
MAQLNVQITGAPGPQRVDCSAANAEDWAKFGTLFPASRMTNDDGQINFINTDAPLPNPLAVVFASQQAISPIVKFDGTADVTVTMAYAPFKRPAPVAPRVYRGQMCGIHVAGAPAVPGGASVHLTGFDHPQRSGDTSLILSWFYGRYRPEWRAKIRAAYRAAGYLDVLTSWTDDRSYGLTPEEHVGMLQELVKDGLRPCEMLTSKYYCPQDNGDGSLDVINEVLPLLVDADCVSRYCTGFEMNLWNTYDSLQTIIDGVAGLVVPDRPFYVHFSPGYADWRPDRPGSTFADFWNPQAGKLTGLWHQADPNWWNSSQPDAVVKAVAAIGSASMIDLVQREYRDHGGKWFPPHRAPRQTVSQPQWGNDLYQALLSDVTSRFAGNFNVVGDSGFGHPFDCTALEITAMLQYDGTMTEAEGNVRGDVALATPPQHGPGGEVVVMGSGNGQSH